MEGQQGSQVDNEVRENDKEGHIEGKHSYSEYIITHSLTN